MTRRTFALIILFAGAIASFALAMWSATRGRLPLVETAHALLFAVMAMILTNTKEPGASACRECGNGMTSGIEFCLQCGQFPKAPPTRAV